MPHLSVMKDQVVSKERTKLWIKVKAVVCRENKMN